MTHIPLPWIGLASSIVFGSLSQITLKHATNQMKASPSPYKALPWLALWVMFFGVATGCWLLALRQLDISYAYPLLSLGYVLVTILAVLLLHEHVCRKRWIAVGLITCGAGLVAGSV